MRNHTWAALAFLATSIPLQAGVIYVNDDAAGVNDGSDWANAYTSLQDALASAQAGDQLWVAVGSYRPDEGAGRIIGSQLETFDLKSGVKLFGGFDGTRSDPCRPLKPVH